MRKGTAGSLEGPRVGRFLAGLGLLGPVGRPCRTGRMPALSHAGSVVGAAGAGLLGYLACRGAGFWLRSIPSLVVLAVFALALPQIGPPEGVVSP